MQIRGAALPDEHLEWVAAKANEEELIDMTIPIGVLLVVAAVYAVKHKGADTPGMFLGLCVGVEGANGVIGQLTRQVIQVLIQAVTAMVHSLPIQ